MYLVKYLCAVTVGLLGLGMFLCAEEGKETGQTRYTEDFDKLSEGDLPDNMLVIDGEFQIRSEGKGKVVELAGTPIQESGFVFGRSSKGEATVQVDVYAGKKRRSYPRFGVGLHGLAGPRLRVVPASKKVEIFREDSESPVQETAFEWKADQWWTLRLSLKRAGDGKGWIVRVWVWPRGTDQPEKPLLERKTDEVGSGKPSVWGTPYTGLPIKYDNLKAD